MYSAPGAAVAPGAPTRAALVTGAVLLLLYGLTLAPDVTLWDAGEFSAAAAVYGIPHPPGTPLYVTIARAWTLLLGAFPVAVAVNSLSAVCSAAAFAMLGALITRWSGSALWGIAAALCAGTFSTAWSNAIAAEVYAPALLAAVLVLWAAERMRAARSSTARVSWGVVAAYLLSLSLPLHLSTLLVVPAAMFLAAGGSRRGWPGAAMLGGAAALAAGIALAAVPLLPLGVVSLLLGAWYITEPAWRSRLRATLLSTGAVVLALSALLILPTRALHDPPLNQGNPSTAPALRDVVLRRQYAIAPIWPRQAPLWLQLGNVVEYADWQVALSFARGPVPTIPRTTATLLFTALGIVGALAQRRRDRVGWAAVLLLVLAGGPGAALHLNLKAGPSFGHGVLPDDAPREARERDYFFILFFTGWGLWAGMGAVALARRAPKGSIGAAALMLPLAPAALNLGAVNGRSLPDARLARDFAESLLLSAPRDAVLMTAGDNDSYPLWYVQMAHGRRPDVLVLPLPLLPAAWFRAELLRREGIDAGSASESLQERVALIARITREQGRPLAISPVMGVPRFLGDTGSWRRRGVVRVWDPGGRMASPTMEERAVLRGRLAAQSAAPDALSILAGGRGAPRIDPAPAALRNSLLCAGLLSGVWMPATDGDLLARGCVPR